MRILSVCSHSPFTYGVYNCIPLYQNNFPELQFSLNDPVRGKRCTLAFLNCVRLDQSSAHIYDNLHKLTDSSAKLKRIMYALCRSPCEWMDTQADRNLHYLQKSNFTFSY